MHTTKQAQVTSTRRETVTGGGHTDLQTMLVSSGSPSGTSIRGSTNAVVHGCTSATRGGTEQERMGGTSRPAGPSNYSIGTGFGRATSVERASIHGRTQEDSRVDGCIRSRLGSNHAQSRGNLRLVQHIRGSHRPEGIQGRRQCHQSVPTTGHRASSPRGQHGVLLLPEEMGGSHPQVKQSHARIMGLLPSDERVHRATLCTQRAQPSERVEPSTSDIDGSITGSQQHGNDLEDIFVDR